MKKTDQQGKGNHDAVLAAWADVCARTAGTL